MPERLANMTQHGCQRSPEMTVVKFVVDQESSGGNNCNCEYRSHYRLTNGSPWRFPNQAASFNLDR
jgi:hypothetical protein